MNRKALAIILLLVGATCAAAAMKLGRPALALAAFVFFGFAAGSLLSKAGRLLDALYPMKGHRVYVAVWDSDIPGSTGSEFQLHGITAIGAGLHLFLRSDTGLRGDLKIAQPGSSAATADSLIIHTAKYVSWKGHRITPPQDRHSPAVTIRRIG